MYIYIYVHIYIIYIYTTYILYIYICYMSVCVCVCVIYITVYRFTFYKACHHGNCLLWLGLYYCISHLSRQIFICFIRSLKFLYSTYDCLWKSTILRKLKYLLLNTTPFVFFGRVYRKTLWKKHKWLFFLNTIFQWCILYNSGIVSNFKTSILSKLSSNTARYILFVIINLVL